VNKKRGYKRKEEASKEAEKEFEKEMSKELKPQTGGKTKEKTTQEDKHYKNSSKRMIELIKKELKEYSNKEKAKILQNFSKQEKGSMAREIFFWE
jgi:hypothetical protein